MCSLCQQHPCHPRCPNAERGGVYCSGYQETLLPDESYTLVDGFAYSLYYLDTELDAKGLLELLDIPVYVTPWGDGDGM